MKKERRRIYLIDKPMQLWCIGWVLLGLLVVSGYIVAAFYFGIWNQAVTEFSGESVRNMLQMTSRLYDYEIARYSTEKEVTVPRLALTRESELFSQRQREIIADILDRVKCRLAFLAIPLILLIALSAILLSHKIAGPLYRFNQSFKELEKKNLALRIKLRRFDQLQQLPKSFNAAVDGLDKSISKIKKILRETPDAAQSRDQILKELSQFKTSHE